MQRRTEHAVYVDSHRCAVVAERAAGGILTDLRDQRHRDAQAREILRHVAGDAAETRPDLGRIGRPHTGRTRQYANVRSSAALPTHTTRLRASEALTRGRSAAARPGLLASRTSTSRGRGFPLVVVDGLSGDLAVDEAGQCPGGVAVGESLDVPVNLVRDLANDGIVAGGHFVVFRH